MAPAHGIDTDGLVELLVLPLGPLRAKGVWALEQWSYPDYQALRDATLGMSITGWTQEFSEFGSPTPDRAAPARAFTLYVSANHFSTFGVTLAPGGVPHDAVHDGKRDGHSADARSKSARHHGAADRCGPQKVNVNPLRF
jgi:hypothetical protein